MGRIKRYSVHYHSLAMTYGIVPRQTLRGNACPRVFKGLEPMGGCGH